MIINPGTEAVSAPTLANAAAAVELFISDLGLTAGHPVMIQRTPEHDNLTRGIGGGRFAFRLSTRHGACEVDMPGCPPALTRESRPFRSPRLYVDGSSWLWGFALGIAASRLFPDPEG